MRNEEGSIMERRTFLMGSAIGAGALAGRFGIEGKPAAARELDSATSSAEKIGRPVRIVSIGFTQSHHLEEIAELVEKEGAAGADIIALPETFRGQDEKSQESLEGAAVKTMAGLAKKHHAYIVCPIDRRDGERRYNSAVLLDRNGEVACVYNKLYPVYQVECVKNPPVCPGEEVQVYQTDFGRVGFAICFDVNWGALWERLSNQGAELVIWSSAYSAGRSLQARATDYNYYIVSSTWIPDCRVYDIDGEQLVHDANNRGNGINVTRIILDLDRCIFHQDINVPDKRDRLLKDHGEEVMQEKWLPMEGWFVLKAKRPGVSARNLAKQYDLEELRHYINRSRAEIDKCRGWEFS
jgi:predicted amidohydrolase